MRKVHLVFLVLVTACTACGSSGSKPLPSPVDPLAADLAAHVDLSRVTVAAEAWFDEHESFVGFTDQPVEGVVTQADKPAVAGNVSINLATDTEIVLSSGGAPGHAFCVGIAMEQTPIPTVAVPDSGARPSATPDEPMYMQHSFTGASDARSAPHFQDCGPEGSETVIPDVIWVHGHQYSHASGWVGDLPPECVSPAELQEQGNWPLTSLGRVSGAAYDGTAVYAKIRADGDGAELLTYMPKWDPDDGVFWMRLTEDCYGAYTLRFMG